VSAVRKPVQVLACLARNGKEAGAKSLWINLYADVDPWSTTYAAVRQIQG
jgi:hypothetical protein